jgi:glycosyltransferase involved in cell wall biosynthesis
MPIVVSVVVPVRNEERYVGECLRSILGGTYAAANMEILVVDGCSSDNTRAIVADIARRHPIVRLLDNPAKQAACAMNIGIRSASGTFVIRVDAHATYPPEYIDRLLTATQALDADNVGGIFLTEPGGSGVQARAVPHVMTHPFGVGNSMYRLRQERAPYRVDTVPFGCYRRELLERIGLYDETFVRNQDDELNARLSLAGGRIYLLPDLHIRYFARDRLRKMGHMFYEYGYFKPCILFKLRRLMTLRQLAPPAFVIALVGLPLAGLLWPVVMVPWVVIVALYIGTACAAAVGAASRQGLRVAGCVALGFGVAHLSYGFGYLRGLVSLIARIGDPEHSGATWSGSNLRTVASLRPERISMDIQPSTQHASPQKSTIS